MVNNPQINAWSASDAACYVYPGADESHLRKAFCEGSAWAAGEIHRLQERGREAVATWMAKREYATGHGDTLEDLLGEIEAQAIERSKRAEG